MKLPSVGRRHPTSRSHHRPPARVVGVADHGEIGVSGSVGGRRLRARLIAGLEAPASARLEAFALGQQIFIVAARAGDATLLLTRENRILEHGRTDEILEAVAGIPLDAADLRTTLVGCPRGSTSAGPGSGGGTVSSTSRRIGDDWRVLDHGPSELYFHRESRQAPWRLVASVRRDPGRPAWRVEYRKFENNLPQAIHMISIDSSRFDLRLELSQVELNTRLPSAAFDVRVPPSADPITIQELRRRPAVGRVTRVAPHGPGVREDQPHLRVLGVRPTIPRLSTTFQTIALTTLTFTTSRGPFEIRTAIRLSRRCTNLAAGGGGSVAVPPRRQARRSGAAGQGFNRPASAGQQRWRRR